MNVMRAYAVFALVCLSVTAVTACIFIADENARKITLGSESAVFTLGNGAKSPFSASDNKQILHCEIDVRVIDGKITVYADCDGKAD